MRLTKHRLLVFAFIALVGCQNTPPPSPVVIEPHVLFTPETGLSSKQRLRKGIALLSEGQSGQAGAELQAYLDTIKKSRIASNLLRQINTPISEYYPQEFVAITLTNGESLSTIAKQYLGDPLQFYALAQYNNIDNPGKTIIGQVIRVPLTSSAQAFIDFKKAGGMDISNTEQDKQAKAQFEENTQDDKPVSEPQENLQLEQDLLPQLTGKELLAVQLADKKYLAAIATFERLPPAKRLEVTDNPALISAYEYTAIEAGKLNPTQASDGYLKAGDLLVLQGNQDFALQMFKRSHLADTTNTQVKKKYHSLKKDLTNRYHRDASLAFRRQELDKAITLWQKVLFIDSAHVHAKSHLLKAENLKNKLKQL